MESMKKHAALVAISAALSVAAFGCNDPAKDKAKATTSDPVTATSAAVSATGQTATYNFDQTNSKVQWTGSKVTGKHDGGFGTFKGNVKLVDGAPEKSKVDVEIETASISSDAEKLTTHLKSADFFDVEKNPKATFVSTEVKKGGDKGATHTVTGNLTVKGITKAITFPATIKTEGDSVSVDADFAINRRDFQLNYAGMPNDLIRDDVAVKLTVKAPKSKG